MVQIGVRKNRVEEQLAKQGHHRNGEMYWTRFLKGLSQIWYYLKKKKKTTYEEQNRD